MSTLEDAAVFPAGFGEVPQPGHSRVTGTVTRLCRAGQNRLTRKLAQCTVSGGFTGTQPPVTEAFSSEASGGALAAPVGGDAPGPSAGS